MSEEVPSWAKLLCAAILYSHKIARDTKEACQIAEELAAHIQHKPELEVWARTHIDAQKSWAEGVKHVTGGTRSARAKAKFLSWLQRTRLSAVRTGVNHPGLQQWGYVYRGLADWQKQGFTREELEYLKEKFSKYKVKGQGRNRFCDEYLHAKLGLFRLEGFSTNLPWAKAK